MHTNKNNKTYIFKTIYYLLKINYKCLTITVPKVVPCAAIPQKLGVSHFDIIFCAAEFNCSRVGHNVQSFELLIGFQKGKLYKNNSHESETVHWRLQDGAGRNTGDISPLFVQSETAVEQRNIGSHFLQCWAIY